MSRLLVLVVVVSGCTVGDPADTTVPDAVFDTSLAPDQDIYFVGDVPDLEADAPALDISSEIIEDELPLIEAAGLTSPEQRAAAAWRALTMQMGTNVPGLFRNHNTGSDIAPIWAFSQAFAGAIDRAKLTGRYRDVETMRSALQLYRHRGYYAANVNPNDGTDRYWDDNGWIGLDLLQAYEQTHDRRFKFMALNLYRFIRAGFSPEGGVAWRVGQNPPHYGVPATGSATMFAARLYMITHDQRFLADAKKHYAWLVSPKQRRSDGFYWQERSYDDGLGIGAGVLLYRITHEHHYLADAIQTANATLAHYANGGFWDEWAVFNAIFFRNLLALDAVAPDPRYRAAMEGYLQRAWTQGRDTNTGLFDRGGLRLYGDPAPPSGLAATLDQGGFVQMYSLLAWPKDALGEVD